MVRSSLFTRQFWRDYLVDARRFSRDKRARKNILARTLLVLGLLAYLGYYVALLGSLHDPVSVLGIGVGLLGIVVVVGATRISQRREARRQLAADIASAPTETTVRLQHLAHGTAAITERALGELWLQSNTVAEEQTVTTRQIQIQALKRAGVWEVLPLPVRSWTIRPDGSWSPGVTAAVLSRAEFLHTLLWILGLAQTLRSLETMGKPLNFRQLARALKLPAPGIRPTWDMRIERNRANEYFVRCYAERIHRGDLEADDQEQKRAVETWMGEIDSGEIPDALAGVATIGELDTSHLHQVGLSAACRLRALTLVMELLDGVDVWTDLEVMAYGMFPEDSL